jgi:hypothetical protein
VVQVQKVEEKMQPIKTNNKAIVGLMVAVE